MFQKFGARGDGMGRGRIRAKWTAWSFALVLSLLIAPGVLAPAFGQSADPGAGRAVIEQKLKLLESVLNSPKITQAAASTDPEVSGLVAKSRKGLEDARAALNTGDLSAAANLLDQALRASSLASQKATRAASPSTADALQRTRNSEMLEEVAAYRSSIADALKRKPGAKGSAALDRIDKLVAQAAELTSAQRHAEAGKAIAEAYGIAVATVSELRAGETITHELKFDTPADEFAYEQKRHRSNEMLIDMMIKEGKLDPGRRQLLDRYLEDSFKLRSQAEQLAKGGDYPAAIKTMEKANDQIMNALRASGLASF
jgi:tetratricopeptide (TPR) repeat protein